MWRIGGVALAYLLCGYDVTVAQDIPRGQEGEQVEALVTRTETKIDEGDLTGGRLVNYTARLGQLRLVVEDQYDKQGAFKGERGLAHYFISPDNGGWSRWRFLEVKASGPDGRERSLLPGGLLESANLIDQGDRAVAQFVWLVEAATRPQTDATGPALYLRVLRRPSDRFTYCRLALDHPSLKLSRIVVSGYPHSTTGEGYELRQRWVASLKQTQCCHQPVTLPADDWAIFLFNRQAQEDAGMELVLQPGQAASITVGGSYGVACSFTPAEHLEYPNSVAFAISEWRDLLSEQARRRFLETDAPRALLVLNQLDWLARPERLAQFQAVTDVEELLRCAPLRAKHGRAAERVLSELRRLSSELRIMDKARLTEAWRSETRVLALATQAEELARQMMKEWIDSGYWDQ